MTLCMYGTMGTVSYVRLYYRYPVPVVPYLLRHYGALHINFFRYNYNYFNTTVSDVNAPSHINDELLCTDIQYSR